MFDISDWEQGGAEGEQFNALSKQGLLPLSQAHNTRCSGGTKLSERPECPGSRGRGLTEEKVESGGVMIEVDPQSFILCLHRWTYDKPEKMIIGQFSLAKTCLSAR